MSKVSEWVVRYSELRETYNMTDSIDKLVEEVAASLNRQGCRWTKASERLPENNVKAFWRKQINHDYYVGYDYFNDHRFMELDKIEWLYESTPTPIPTGDRDCEELLLSFCHFLGKAGYKINGYDDSQLLTVINQFKAKHP